MTTKAKYLLAAGISLLALFVWPTPYRYDRVGPNNALTRTNRLTGESAILTMQGWQGSGSDSGTTSPLPAEALARLEVQCRSDKDKLFPNVVTCSVYNGNADWTVSEVTLRVTTNGRERIYRTSPAIGRIGTYAGGELSFRPEAPLPPGAKYSVIAARN